MRKQAISVTLSPDNLVWLKGRTRADGAGSLSECLDRLLTKARFGGSTARPVRSMRGALASLAAGELDGLPAVSAEVWRGWQARWDDLLALAEVPAHGPATRHRGRHAAAAPAAAPSMAAGPRRRGRRG